MIPLADVHCHLLAGLDDGPSSQEEALTMCRQAVAEGTRAIAATAHQSERYPANTPPRILAATQQLAARLAAEGIDLPVYPCAEVMLRPNLDVLWARGALLGMAGKQRYLMIEYPPGPHFAIGGLVERLQQAGVRPILAHAERYPHLLQDRDALETLIAAGCLVQVTASSLVEPRHRAAAEVVQHWLESNLVHVVGSDGHSPRHRPPRMADACQHVVRWVGEAAATRIFWTHGLAVLEGRPLDVPRPQPRSRWWAVRWLLGGSGRSTAAPASDA